MKILVVDDSGVQRKMISQIIQKAGFDHEILEACDGEVAIQTLAQNYKDVALVLCDWNMPKMNGLEFIQGVAKVPPVAQIPIVMVTTEGTADKIEQAKQAGSNLAGYIVKPFTPPQLKEVISPILAKTEFKVSGYDQGEA
ncbi:MAG: response regulator [Candidatus Omnitrophica bacterium]|nr:response regulator [Candidatus Omnitrophota bacterium]